MRAVSAEYSWPSAVRWFLTSGGTRWCALFAAILFCFVDGSPLDPVKHVIDFDLNSWIKHYDVATYDIQSLSRQHATRVRRDPEGAWRGGALRLEVKGHGRTFKLLLYLDEDVFAEDVVFESTSRPKIDFDRGTAYTGTLEDDESAVVHGIVTSNGLFEGTVTTQTEEYHIEPVSRFLASNATKEPRFHSVIYRTSDVRDPRVGVPCRSHTFYQKDVNSVQENGRHSRAKRWVLQAEAKLPYDEDYFMFQNRSKRPILTAFDINQQQIDEELEIGNRTMVDASALVFGKNVYKRATIDPKKTTCMLYLQADHMFFQKYGTEESCIEVMTRHVQRVNAIYKNTDFNQDGKADNITFMVKRIKVHTLEALKDPLYRFPNNYGVEKFLELFSEEDYDAFCLAYMFTYRDFEMGTLGLAWTGDLKNAGGVCEKNGHYRGSMKSLNTGIVTLLNYGKHVPPAVSHVTLAHEIGHNFGSPHDPEQCTPGGEDGNFIMFARATSGDKKNNNKFSPCSLKSISPVLNYKARSAKGCFTEPKEAICGNGVVEEGEQCDCGWEEDCRDQCCFPMRRYPPLDEPPCMLTPRSICSPSQGPCCTTDCQVKFGDKCRDDNGCRDESFCNGREAICPPSVNKPNRTICNKEFVCFMGECTGSICLAYGLESCQCIPRTSDPKTKACELCCKIPGDDQPCISSFEWNHKPYDIPDMYSKPGTPCNDYSGYCDVFQMCREVDPSGPLATLRKLLLSEESLASFRKWMIDYWYVVGSILGFIFTLLFLSTKYLGKRQNSKLKSVTIMHKSTTEAVRLPPDTEGVTVVHPGIHSKVPLKRKVRDGKVKRKRKPKTESTNNNLNSPTKLKSSPKKKKRVSAAISAEETTRNKFNGNATEGGTPSAIVVDVPHSKVKKPILPAKKKKKSKEIIDYSSIKPEIDCQKPAEKSTNEMVHTPLTPESDPVNKVQHWLKSQYALPKSKSTPVKLTDLTDKTRRSPHKRPTIRPRADKSKSHSVGNISDKDKVKLQVVYKPPFKFSVKLRKPEKTSVVIEPVKKPHTVRTGVLVRTTIKEIDNAVAKPIIREITTSENATTASKVDQNHVAKSSDNKEHTARASINSGNAVKPENVEHDYENVELNSGAVATQQLLNLATLNSVDDNVHTVHSDLEVLLSENDYENVD